MNNDDPTDQVLSVIHAVYDNWAAGDADAFAELYTDDAASSARSEAQASGPAAGSFTSIFTPRLILPVPVKAPSIEQEAAFTALNALIDTETRFGDAVIGMRVSLDRAHSSSTGTFRLPLGSAQR